MATSEITEEIDENDLSTINYEAQRKRIRRIIAYQKSLHFSSSSSLPPPAASCSSFASSRTNTSLLDLMKGGNSSLKRLFDSDTDDKIRDSWEEIRKIGNLKDLETVSHSQFDSGGSFRSTESKHEKKKKNMRSKLTQKKSSRKLPDLGLWRCRGLGFKLRLKKG